MDSFLKTENGHSVLALSDDLFQNAITVVYEDLNREYVVLKEKSTKNDIRISFPGFDRLLIWSCPGASFVCIEPWCGMAEYESSMDISLVPGIHFLRHGDCFQGTHTISF